MKNAMPEIRQLSKEKKILDVTCGARSFWFNKNHPNAVYCDWRDGDFPCSFGEKQGGMRTVHIHPDIQCDFTCLPFEDNRFALVVFDPPHLARISETSWVGVKYGRLDENWRDVLRAGFEECMRVLRNEGVLIFKWAETEFPTREIIDIFGQKPLFGHKSGKRMKTNWMAFIKLVEE